MKNYLLHTWAFTAILTVASAVSITLTGMFAYELGSAIGSGPIVMVFVVIGILLDVTKIFTPTLAYKSASTSIPLSLALTALTVLLIFISFFASYSAFEQSIAKHENQSSEYLAISNQIAMFERELRSVSDLSDRQKKVTQLSKADVNLVKVSSLTEKLANLYERRLSINKDSVVAKWGNELILLISAVLEIITLVSAMTLAHLRSLNYAKQHRQHRYSATPDEVSTSRHFSSNTSNRDNLKGRHDFKFISKREHLDRAYWMQQNGDSSISSISKALGLNYHQCLLLTMELEKYSPETKLVN